MHRSRTKTRWSSAVWRGLLVGSVVMLGCGPGAGKPAEAVRPTDPTAGGVLGEAECHEVEGKPSEPLIVDWKPEQRSDLEVAMREGVALVSYSCKQIKVLTDCRLEGKYGFIGTTRQEQVVQLQNADELAVNLPLSGAKLGAEMARGSTLDVAMVMVGKKRTTWDKPTKADLKGSCDGATHFVRGATVGAFAMDTGTEGKVRAAAEMFGVGASGGSTSNKKTSNKQGDLKECAQSSPEAAKPPGECGAPIRLVLHPLAAAPEATKLPAAPSPGEAPPAAPVKHTEEAEACPPGLVFSGGKCTKPAAATAYACKPGDKAECQAQCDKGDAASCAELGLAQVVFARGGSPAPGVKQNELAFAALKKGCDGNNPRACGALGDFYLSGVGGAKVDRHEAMVVFKKGCDGGDAHGCRELGRFYRGGTKEVPEDHAKAAALYRQACEGGEPHACSFLAHAHAEGDGVEKDGQKALSLAMRSCDGRSGPGCNYAGNILESGLYGVGKNPILAEITYRRGCLASSDFASACTSLGRLSLLKGNAQEATSMLERGCAFGDARACAILKLGLGVNRTAVADPGELSEATARCSKGEALACTDWGLLQGLQSPQAAKPTLQRACTQGDKFACAMADKIK